MNDSQSKSTLTVHQTPIALENFVLTECSPNDLGYVIQTEAPIEPHKPSPTPSTNEAGYVSLVLSFAVLTALLLRK